MNCSEEGRERSGMVMGVSGEDGNPDTVCLLTALGLAGAAIPLSSLMSDQDCQQDLRIQFAELIIVVKAFLIRTIRIFVLLICKTDVEASEVS
jgi:hypothetical protein